MKSVFSLLISCLLAHAHETLDLKIEHQTVALGLDDANPLLTWRMEGEEKELAQTSYQILFATSEAGLSPEKVNLWDSRRINSISTN
jgi:alpha-L-rhamnosidase